MAVPSRSVGVFNMQYSGGLNGMEANGHRGGPGLGNGVTNSQYHSGNHSGDIPPMESKGRHRCPRCARKFKSRADCDEHKTRCLA